MYFCFGLIFSLPSQSPGSNNSELIYRFAFWLLMFPICALHSLTLRCKTDIPSSRSIGEKLRILVWKYFVLKPLWQKQWKIWAIFTLFHLKFLYIQRLYISNMYKMLKPPSIYSGSMSLSSRHLSDHWLDRQSADAEHRYIDGPFPVMLYAILTTLLLPCYNIAQFMPAINSVV